MFRSTLAALLAISLASVSAGGAVQQRQQQPTVVILVRHAEKATADPQDRDPPLTPAGEQRARDLWDAVRGSGVSAVITTELRRTRMTAQPTADALHLTPEVVPASAQQGRTAGAVADLVRRRHAGQTVLVVGHSNTIPETIVALGGASPGGDICDSQYGNLFVVVIRPRAPSSVTHAHYGAPDPPGGAGCVNGIMHR